MKKGFALSLIEVMMVIAIFMLLSAIAVPNLIRARRIDICVAEKGNKIWCHKNWKTYISNATKEKQIIKEEIILSEFEKDFRQIK